uniref:Uncharacterized protein n=1 Tax=Arundo donax TaxID=35708 RepID=A0A0A9E957_ARUDO
MMSFYFTNHATITLSLQMAGLVQLSMIAQYLGYDYLSFKFKRYGDQHSRLCLS